MSLIYSSKSVVVSYSILCFGNNISISSCCAVKEISGRKICGWVWWSNYFVKDNILDRYIFLVIIF